MGFQQLPRAGGGGGRDEVRQEEDVDKRILEVQKTRRGGKGKQMSPDVRSIIFEWLVAGLSDCCVNMMMQTFAYTLFTEITMRLLVSAVLCEKPCNPDSDGLVRKAPVFITRQKNGGMD